MMLLKFQWVIVCNLQLMCFYRLIFQSGAIGVRSFYQAMEFQTDSNDWCNFCAEADLGKDISVFN